MIEKRQEQPGASFRIKMSLFMEAKIVLEYCSSSCTQLLVMIRSFDLKVPSIITTTMPKKNTLSFHSCEQSLAKLSLKNIHETPKNSTNTTIVVTFFDPPFNVIHKTFLKSGSTVRFVLIVSVFESNPPYSMFPAKIRTKTKTF